MHALRIGVFGASGYAGIEFTRLCAVHPALKVAFLARERQVGTRVGDFVGVEGPVARLAYVGFDEARRAARECAAVFLATPADVSLALAPELLGAGVKVVDLSGGFPAPGATAAAQARFGAELGRERALRELVGGAEEPRGVFACRAARQRPVVQSARPPAHPGDGADALARGR